MKTNITILICLFTFGSLPTFGQPGTLDVDFSSDGKATTDFDSSDIAWSVAIQPDGKVLVAGSSHIGTDDDFALVRYNTDGSLDNTFSGDGKLTTDFGKTEVGISVTIQPDGKILVAGLSGNFPDNDFALARYNTDGSLDNTFSGDGKVTTDFGNFDEGQSVVIQPDGKILVAGYSHNGSDWDFALVRYIIDGTLDSSFGADGKVTTQFGNDLDRGHSATIDLDGKIVVAGYSDNGKNDDFAVARYLSGLNVGLLDFSVENQMTLIYPNPISNQATLEYSLTQEEKISIRLVDISGKLLNTFIDQESRLKGEHKEELDFPESIPAGQYVLVIDNGSKNRSIKIIKK